MCDQKGRRRNLKSTSLEELREEGGEEVGVGRQWALFFMDRKDSMEIIIVVIRYSI